MKRLRWILTLLVLAGVGWYLVDALLYMNLFAAVPSKVYGVCRKVGGVIGPEDMVLTRDGRSIISSDARKNDAVPDKNGAILVYRAGKETDLGILWDGRGRSFHPHGIDYFVAKNGVEYLFVIDHRTDHDQVEIFRLVDQHLELVREVPMPDTKTLNDLVAVAPDQFYVTVDHASSSPAFNKISDYLRLPTGYVGFFNGSTFEHVVPRVNFANGIALSADRRYIFVASMLRGRVIAYLRNEQSGSLQERYTIDVGGSPDNITIADDGGLVVAVHAKILSLAKQRDSRDFRAPSVIKYVRVDEGQSPLVKTIYSDAGAEQAAASVAILRDKRLIVGSVYDDHILECDGSSR